MACILPGFDELLALLNSWSDCCPKCGGRLTLDSLYCGGRGYRAYEICQSEGDCDFMRAAS